MAANPALILNAAWDQAVLSGFASISRRSLVGPTGLSIGSISSYPGGMNGLRADLVRRIITEGNVTLLAQALADGHAGALAAPVELREAAGRLIAGVE